MNSFDKNNKKGGPLVEYMPLISLLSIIVIIPVISLRTKVGDVFNTTTNALSTPTTTPVTPPDNPYETGYPDPNDPNGWFQLVG